jgi:hypothetical protein
MKPISHYIPSIPKWINRKTIARAFALLAIVFAGLAIFS